MTSQENAQKEQLYETSGTAGLVHQHAEEKREERATSSASGHYLTEERVGRSRRSKSHSRSRSSSRDYHRSRSSSSRSRDRRSNERIRKHNRDHRKEERRSRSISRSPRRRSGSRSRDENSPDKRGSKRSRPRQEDTEQPPEEGQIQSYPKKKKEYKATSSYVGDDEFEDILERGWFYLDSNGDKQGPFTTKEMKEWFVAGFFNNELLVKRVSDPTFQKISEREEFALLERKPTLATYVPTQTYEQRLEQESAPNPFYQDFPAYYDPSYEPEPQPVEPVEEDPTSYSQSAYFTTLGGRFSAADQATHWKKKGLPQDKDGRMLSHYFDVDAYQEQMRNMGPPKKKKVTKTMIKFYKKRKEDRKRRRALML